MQERAVFSPAGSWRMLLGIFLVLLVAACQASVVEPGPQEKAFSAVRSNDETGLGQYLAGGGDPNARNEDGDSLLYVASGAKGGVEVARALISAGADIDMISREGRTALHTAAAWCNADIVELLLAAGARTDIANSEGNVAMDVICSRPPDRREQVLALFFKARAGR